ncbi:hypothetical protein [Ekhidna sp.]
MIIRLIDFGLVILIWMTQLVVYPSFTYFSSENLFTWHQKYTTVISIIVMPLMIGQVALHSYQLYQGFSGLRLLAFVLIILAWANTFLVAVPLHNKINANVDIIDAANSLVKINWYRTVLWSGVFLVGLYEHLRN